MATINTAKKKDRMKVITTDLIGARVAHMEIDLELGRIIHRAIVRHERRRGNK